MPSTDTWTSIAGFRQPAYEGRKRTWTVTPGFGGLPKDSKPVNYYLDIQYRGTQSFHNLKYQTASPPGAFTVQYDDENFTGADLDANVEQFTTANIVPLVAGIQNATQLKALVKIADAKVNVAVAYAEARKTSDLILDTANRVHKAYQAFRRGNLAGVAKNLNITPKRLHKSWLEYKYGWMPLLMDVKGAAEFFAQQQVVRPPRFQVSATEEVVKTASGVVTDQAYGGGGFTKNLTYLKSGSYKCRVKIWCELSSPHLSELQQIGLTNPALVAWELIPFSFVFDWFVSVGDWLTGLTALQGVTVRRAMLSSVQAVGVSFSLAPTNNVVTAENRRYIDSGYTAAFSKRSYNRAPLSLSPGSLYPPVTNSFGFSKLVTSLALIQGNYRGNSRTSRI